MYLIIIIDMINIIEVYLEEKVNFKQNCLHLSEIKNQIEDLNLREMYTIDKKYCFDISSFIIKNNCILIKFDFFRCIIFENKAYILDSDNNEVKKTLKCFNSNIQNYDKNQIFHIFIIDNIFSEICDYFYQIIQKITHDISDNNENIKKGRYNYINFTILQSNLVSLEYKIKELKNITEEIADNKDDIKGILLNSNNTENEVLTESIQNMFETYLLKFQDLENDISRFTKEMDNTQKILNINLLTQRNYYAVLQTYISMVTLSISIGSFVGSMYGMNLYNKMEDNEYAFYFVSVGCIVFILFFSCLQIFCLKNSNIQLSQQNFDL